MNALDIVLFIILIYGIAKGIIKGFVLEAASFVGVILGIYLAKIYSDRTAVSVHEWFYLSTKYAKPMGFLLLFVLVILICHFLAKLLDRAVKLVLLDWLNKVAGAFLGLLKYALVLSIFLNVFQVMDNKVKMIKQEKKDSSLLYNPLKNLVPTIMPYVDWDDFVKNTPAK